MIVIIAGSGASRALSEHYPTTVEFVAKMPPGVVGETNSPYQKILAWLQAEKRQVDIEEILGVVNRLRKDTQVLHEAGQGIMRIFAQAPSGASQVWVNLLHQIQGHSPSLGRVLENMSTEIKGLMWKHYAHRPSAERLDATWIPFMKAATEVAAEFEQDIEIYTLNYDRVLETAMEALEAELPDWNIERGSMVSGGSFVIDPDKWKISSDQMRREGKRYILLTKLHGSLNWTREEGRVVIGSWMQPPMDLSAACLIYPEIEKDASSEPPFATFYDRLSASIRSAAAVISVGYAHRDPAVEKLLKSADEAHLLVVNRDGMLAETLKRRGHKRAQLLASDFEGAAPALGKRLGEIMRSDV